MPLEQGLLITLKIHSLCKVLPDILDLSKDSQFMYLL
jgi:hypothetical protein